MKILCVGNSFSHDTTWLLPRVMTDLGFENFVVANLYIGGCPICKHYENIRDDLPAYTFFRSDGGDWSEAPDTGIRDAICSENWDWICIQHGSSYGGRYTEPESYADLPALVKAVKALSHAKIAFNLTWVGVPEKDRPEMLLYNRDQVRYFTAICHVTRQLVASLPGIDLVCPTGTAVQYARALLPQDRLHRDGYHLSKDLGRYLAALAFLKALTGCSIEDISWMPEGVSEMDKALILQSVNQAILSPYFERKDFDHVL